MRHYDTDPKYVGETAIAMYRVFPKTANMCKLSEYANAINYYTGSTHTPEELLDVLNHFRLERKIPKVDPQKSVISFIDLDVVLKAIKVVKVKRLVGKKFLQRGLWKDLLANDFLIGSYHQMIYDNLKNFTFTHIPPRILNKIFSASKFSYQTFYELYKTMYEKNKTTDLGHVELVLDIKKVDNIDYVILANLASSQNDFHLKIPWNMFTKYMVWDWADDVIPDPTEAIPKKKLFRKMKLEGVASNGHVNFVHGLTEVFYTPSKYALLQNILDKHCA